MELQVTITLSDRLFGLLEDKLPNLGRRVEKAITKELSAQARRESNISVDVSTVASSTSGIENPEPEAPAAPEPVEEAPTQPKPVAGTSAPIMTPAERIREIMHRTRQRFEGEDYKNNPGEAYKKYHKQLTSQFKQIAVILGADKPSTLPDDKIEIFAAECDALIIGEDGDIPPPQAPY